MSAEAMLKRAFNQAMAQNAGLLSGENTDLTIIKNYMMNYAKKYEVEVAEKEVVDYIKKQIRSWNEGLTDFSVSGKKVHIENLPDSYSPKKLTKEEKLEEAFEEAAANPAVRYTDKEADLLVIKAAMMEYSKEVGAGFTPEEVEAYIRKQEKRWDDAITRASVSGGKVDINCSPELYDPREGRQTKEKVLREGFAQAAGSIAVHFVDQEVDFKVIKNMMEEYAKSCHVEVSEEEVVNYMKDAFHKMNEAVKDFSYSYKIMK